MPRLRGALSAQEVHASTYGLAGDSANAFVRSAARTPARLDG
jgi:hypothetical protein